MDDVTVDLGPPLSLFDADAVRLALQVVVDLGYFNDAENYAAVMGFKSRLSYRIAKAEKTAQFVEPA